MTEETLNAYFTVEDVIVIDGRYSHWCKSCGSLVRATRLEGHIHLHTQATRGDSAMSYHTPIF